MKAGSQSSREYDPVEHCDVPAVLPAARRAVRGLASAVPGDAADPVLLAEPVGVALAPADHVYFPSARVTPAGVNLKVRPVATSSHRIGRFGLRGEMPLILKSLPLLLNSAPKSFGSSP